MNDTNSIISQFNLSLFCPQKHPMSNPEKKLSLFPKYQNSITLFSSIYHFFFHKNLPCRIPEKKKTNDVLLEGSHQLRPQRIHRRRVHGDDTHTWRLIFWWFPWKCHGIFSGFHGDVMGIYSDFMGISCWWVGIYWLLNETLIGFHDYNEI